MGGVVVMADYGAFQHRACRRLALKGYLGEILCASPSRSFDERPRRTTDKRLQMA